MRNWKGAFIGLAILMMNGMTTGLEAQEVTDTITITIQGTLTGVALTAEYVTPPRVGDTIIFRALAVDEDGDPINALMTFFTEDSTALRLETITDPSIPVNEARARGIALQKATVRVWVLAEPIEEMRMASFRPPDSLNWTGADTIQLGESLQYCGYLVRSGTLVAESPGPPACPTVFLPPEFPASHVLARAVSGMDRRLAWRELARLARGLPVNPNQN